MAAWDEVERGEKPAEARGDHSMSSDDKIAKQISDAFHSPNEHDVNGEVANVVDGLFFIGRQLTRIAKALEVLGQ